MRKQAAVKYLVKEGKRIGDTRGRRSYRWRRSSSHKDPKMKLRRLEAFHAITADRVRGVVSARYGLRTWTLLVSDWELESQRSFSLNAGTCILYLRYTGTVDVAAWVPFQITHRIWPVLSTNTVGARKPRNFASDTWFLNYPLHRTE